LVEVAQAQAALVLPAPHIIKSFNFETYYSTRLVPRPRTARRFASISSLFPLNAVLPDELPQTLIAYRSWPEQKEWLNSIH
jgi:hypothetical protein